MQYQSETQLKLKSREISFAHNTRLIYQSLWSLTQGTICKIQNNLVTEK